MAKEKAPLARKIREMRQKQKDSVFTRPEENSTAKEFRKRTSKNKKNYLQDSINKNNKRVKNSMKKKKKSGLFSKIFGKGS